MPPESFTIFLDENHCNNHRILDVLVDAEISFERHLEHFPRGTRDEVWLPRVGREGWVLLTSDGRIRYRTSERLAVQKNGVRMFYFSNNNMSGEHMANALRAALPRMRLIHAKQTPPYCASISRAGEVTLREAFSQRPMEDGDRNK